MEHWKYQICMNSNARNQSFSWTCWYFKQITFEQNFRILFKQCWIMIFRDLLPSAAPVTYKKETPALQGKGEITTQRDDLNTIEPRIIFFIWLFKSQILLSRYFIKRNIFRCSIVRVAKLKINFFTAPFWVVLFLKKLIYSFRYFLKELILFC